MNSRFNTKWLKMSVCVVAYIAAIAISFSVMPQVEKFERNYEIGRPWSYGLVTAPVDFPVYKLEADLKKEKDSVKMCVIPYLRQTSSHTIDYSSISNTLLRQYIQQQLTQIYNSGLISADDYSRLNGFNGTYVYIISDNNVAKRYNKSKLYTMKTAYAYIIEHSGILASQIGGVNLNSLLKVNLEIDDVMTQKTQQEALASVLPTMGVVQRGEKIINKGELVDANVYKNLLSMERMSSEMNELTSKQNTYSSWGRIMIVIALFAMLFSYFLFFRTRDFADMRTTLFMLLMSVAMIILSSFVIRYTPFTVYLVPLTILPIVVRIFFDSRTALFLHLITVLVISFIVASPFEYIVIQMSVGIVAVSSLKDLHARSQLIASALYIFITYAFIHTALTFVQGSSFEELKLTTYILYLINSILILFVYGLIYIFEKMFGFLSSMSLVELSNVNNKLLMEFSEKCPGTFQHVLQVSNLSVDVAKKINANILLVRTGAMYHDIGKLDSPVIFTENQIAGVNPLSELPYEEAAQLIISHVQHGVKIAQKHRLPKPIINFIATHHGTSKTKYFYNSFKNAFPDREIDETMFTYSGPLPQSKESVIVMMADAIEAASRSLSSYNEDSIDRMVEGIVNGQMADGQYKNAPISFLQVEQAKQVFKDKLKTIYHNRIKYPELKKV